MKIEIDNTLMVLRDGEPIGMVRDFLNSLRKDTSVDGRAIDSEDLDDAVYAVEDPAERDRLMPYLILTRLVERYEAREQEFVQVVAEVRGEAKVVLLQALVERDAHWQGRVDALEARLRELTEPPAASPEAEAAEVEARAQAALRELRVRTAAEERLKALAAEAGLMLPTSVPPS